MTIVNTSRTPLLHRNLADRVSRRHAPQSRSFWGWGRPKRFWVNSGCHEDTVARMHRHHSLMRHKYSKAMNRYRLWDRDPKVFQQQVKFMSSSDPLHAKVEENQNRREEMARQREQHYKNFEEFKAAVDKAIEKDPFGTLFGRRWQSPSTTGNSGWTTWSWFSDPVKIKDEINKPAEKQATEPTRNPIKPAVQQAPPPSKTGSPTPSVLFTTEFQSSVEYIYDPISGRKILKNPSKPAPTIIEKRKAAEDAAKNKPPAPRKPTFIEQLFLEPGTMFPDKPYMPKVYGYPEAKLSPGPKKSNPIDFEGERKEKIRNKLKNTLGNTMDTSAIYHGQFYVPPEDGEIPDPRMSEEPASRDRVFKATSEESPLFSGTTYANKTLEPSAPPKSSFLEAEGFRAKQGMTLPNLPKTPPTATRKPITQIQSVLDRNKAIEIPVKKFTVKLESALDRATSAKLQPAIDRVTPSKKSPEQPTTPASTVAEAISTEVNKTEDVDLLRASDVRARVRTARDLKQAIEDRRVKERAELEKDYKERVSSEASPATIVSKPGPLKFTEGSKHTVFKHIEEYPSGIVAKTMAKMGFLAADPPVETSKPSTSDNQQSVQTAEKSNMSQLKVARLFHKLTAASHESNEMIKEAKRISTNLAKVQQSVRADNRESDATTSAVNEKSSVVVPEKAAVTTVQAKELAKSEDATDIEVKTFTKPTSSLTSLLKTLSSPPQYIMLTYNNTTDDVELAPLTDLMGKTALPHSGLSTMAAIGGLKNPNVFVKHFVDLDKQGYQLLSGGNDMLIFRHGQVKEQEKPVQSEKTSKAAVVTSEVNAAVTSPTASTATVLDEIPKTVPTPGPSAPTEPRPNTTSRPVIPIAGILPANNTFTSTSPPGTSTAKSTTRVRRQEEVFSGQRKSPIVAPDSPEALWSVMPEPIAKQSQSETETREDYYKRDARSERRQNRDTRRDSTRRERLRRELLADSELTFFARARRFLRRLLIASFVLGSGAYGLGVLAEKQAKQLQGTGMLGNAGNERSGMKRLIMDDEARRVHGSQTKTS